MIYKVPKSEWTESGRYTFTGHDSLPQIKQLWKSNNQLISRLHAHTYTHVNQRSSYHRNTRHCIKVVFEVSVIALSICMQALRNVVGIIIWHDHQRAGSAGTLTDAVSWPSASGASSTVRMAVLADAILIAVLGDRTLGHAVWPVTCIPTVVTHIGTLHTT